MNKWIGVKRVGIIRFQTKINKKKATRFIKSKWISDFMEKMRKT